MAAVTQRATDVVREWILPVRIANHFCLKCKKSDALTQHVFYGFPGKNGALEVPVRILISSVIGSQHNVNESNGEHFGVASDKLDSPQ